MKDLFTKQKTKRVLLYALYMLVVLLTQNILLCEVRPMGVCPMFLPAVAVAVGMFEGATWGTVFSMILGLFADMAYVENTVMFTILLPALAFGAGFVSQFLINRRFFAYMGASLAALLIGGAVQMLGVAVKEGISTVMISTALLQAIWALPLAAAVYLPPARWIE